MTRGYTVQRENKLLGKWSCCGHFETANEAAVYAMSEAAKSRSFCKFSVCHGTPKEPGKIIAGPITGEHR